MKKIEISKTDLQNNLNIIKSDLINTNTKIIAVVKANGMGLDLIQYSKFLVENGIDFLAVATTDEAIKLRKSGITVDILMLTPVSIKSELEDLVNNNIILSIDDKKQIEICEQISTDNKIRAHIKIDTGFCRYGFEYNKKLEILEAVKMCNVIQIEGFYTHFSKAVDKKWTNIQYERFMEVISFLKKNGINPKLLHCCNSTAFLLYKNMYLDAVRLGSIIQGRTLLKKEGLKKIGEFKSIVAKIKTVPKGYNISYGNNYKTKKETKIAVIPVGYIDGLNYKKNRDSFKLSENIISVLIECKKIFKDNSIKVLIDNKQYRIIGRLGMYHAIVDVTDSDVKEGDTVILNINPLNANSDIRREYI